MLKGMVLMFDALIFSAALPAQRWLRQRSNDSQPRPGEQTENSSIIVGRRSISASLFDESLLSFHASYAYRTGKDASKLRKP